KRFGFEAEYRSFQEYEALFQALIDGEIDAATFGRLSGQYFDEKLDNQDKVESAPILFSPYRLYVALPKGRELNSYLIERIDSHLEKFHSDKDSVLYRAQEHYLVSPGESFIEIPGWLSWTLMIGTGVVVFLAIGIFVLKKQVEKQTGKLKEKNRYLKILIDCNQIMVRATDEAELLDRICQILVETGGYSLALIGCGQENIKINNYCCEENDYVGTITGEDNQIKEDDEPTRVAFETGKMKLIENLDDYDSNGKWLAAARKTGSSAMAALPLVVGEKRLGAFAVFTEKKDVFTEWEIRLLNEFAEDISFGLKALRTQKRLADSLREKKTLLQEVHHRVKNNLFTMISFLEMQLVSTEDQNTCDVLEEAITRLNTMALVHKHIYSRHELSTIDFSAYLKELASEVVSTLKGSQTEIELEFNLDQATFSLDMMIPCGLVINELLTNAVRHGFKDRNKGKIKLVFEQSEGLNLLKIRDNGVGLPEDFSFKSAASLGLKLVKTMVEKQLAGELNYSTNGYTEFTIKFPITE
ncbi:MAG: histidine kinase dimerization/phosphoacceptor domain -containing protein, partial [bacterium]